MKYSKKLKKNFYAKLDINIIKMNLTKLKNIEYN